MMLMVGSSPTLTHRIENTMHSAGSNVNGLGLSHSDVPSGKAFRFKLDAIGSLMPMDFEFGEWAGTSFAVDVVSIPPDSKVPLARLILKPAIVLSLHMTDPLSIASLSSVAIQMVYVRWRGSKMRSMTMTQNDALPGLSKFVGCVEGHGQIKLR